MIRSLVTQNKTFYSIYAKYIVGKDKIDIEYNKVTISLIFLTKNKVMKETNKEVIEAPYGSLTGEWKVPDRI